MMVSPSTTRITCAGPPSGGVVGVARLVVVARGGTVRCVVAVAADDAAKERSVISDDEAADAMTLSVEDEVVTSGVLPEAGAMMAAITTAPAATSSPVFWLRVRRFHQSAPAFMFASSRPAYRPFHQHRDARAPLAVLPLGHHKPRDGWRMRVFARAGGKVGRTNR
jgi:hypothetical protein